MLIDLCKTSVLFLLQMNFCSQPSKHKTVIQTIYLHRGARICLTHLYGLPAPQVQAHRNKASYLCAYSNPAGHGQGEAEECGKSLLYLPFLLVQVEPVWGSCTLLLVEANSKLLAPGSKEKGQGCMTIGTNYNDQLKAQKGAKALAQLS